MWESCLSGSVRGRRTTEVWKDLVAPPRKQAENGENKHFPAASGGFCLLEKRGNGETGRGWEDQKIRRSEVEKLRRGED
jgi:hypothetical protein